ncbi:hypothetical protein [Thiocystis violascens]|uniref:DUF3311 domain-containing protein n=1 Tax=Thiocystis violascens (strain ATCC 17096 / DSM 198 / 6111) TaxID=765911 RepID=I3YAP4_THIV6|nr:hypothetical protein [Thiocystis violascens]AFL74062.1 hypothetical protein Thivi_2109 [Thiocystis violascens DSM 198]
MIRATLVRQRLLTLFLAGLLLFFSPLVPRFETLGRWQGVPLLPIYLFAAWAAIIALAAWILSRSRD